MDWKRICISVVVLAALVLGEYLLYSRGILTLSELGVLAGSTLLSLAGIILGVLWRDDIIRWWEARKDLHHRSSIPSIYNKNKKLEQEQALLVSPLYAKLNKNDEIVDFMTTYKISRLNIYSDSQRDDGDAQRKELEKLEEEIKEIMLQHGDLASGRLYDLIKRYKDLKPDWEQDNRFEAKKVLWEIQKITGERQDELRELILKN